MTDEERPRPNPRPTPSPEATGTGGAGAPPRPRRKPPARSAPTASRRAAPAAPPPDDADRTQAVEAVAPERVLVGAGRAHAAVGNSSSSVFALDGGPVEPFDLDEPGEWVRVPRASGWLRRSVVVLVVLGLVAIAAGVSISGWLHTQVHPAGPPGEPVEFTIEQGQATNTVASNLAAAKVISNATVFRYWLRRQGGDQTFQAGDYDLFRSMDYPELLAALRAGPKPPVQIRVTIPPGLTISQMKALLLEKLPGFNETEFDQAMGRSQLNPWFIQLLFPVREGLLFPDTYNIDEDASSNEYALAKRMRDQMDKVLKDLDAEKRAADLGYGLYDVLKIASLIEEEAKIDADRPKIARVIYNRLDRKMTLGIDASTRYAVGKINGEPLTVSDLNSDNPYNTRKVAGLPPTPIALPSRKSIEAALAPAEGRWIFYVLTDEGGVKGAHTFANTQGEFNTAVGVCRSLGYCD